MATFTSNTKLNDTSNWTKRRASQVKSILNNWGVVYNVCKNLGDGITFEIDNILYENRVLLTKAGFIVNNIGRYDNGTIFKCA